MRRLLSRGTASLVAGAVVFAGLPAAPAAAVDPSIAEFNAALDTLADWSDGLGELGKMAESLPLLGSSPGAIAGVDDAINEALTKVRAQVDNGLEYDAVAMTLPDGREAIISAHVEAAPGLGANDKKLTFSLAVEDTEADQSLTIPIDIGGDTSSYSSTGGISATSTVTFGFELIYLDATADVYANVAGTQIGIASTAQITDVTAIESAIGILGLKVVADGTALTLSSNIAATLSDPNNDGKWTLDEIGTAGSLDALVDVGFGAPAGSVSGSLHVQSADAAIGGGVALPGVDLTLGFTWNNIADLTDGPDGLQVSAPEIGEVGAFLNMDLTDLASNIAQLATTLTSIQRTKYSEGATPTGDLDLPFFRGTLADAIPLNESLKKFLTDNVNPADKDAPEAAGLDPAELGKPTFTSLQDMLEKLNAIDSPANITLSNIGFDDTTKKFVFKLGIQRNAPGTPVDLNGAAKTSSGSGPTVSYAPTTVTDTSQAWATDEWAGARIVAGNVGATVASNTATVLTLDATGWVPNVTPTDESPYSLAGATGDVGVVSLADNLQDGDGAGISKANGLTATAKVTPSYSAALTVVLDLRDPEVQDPPLEQGSVVVTALPMAKDRILIRPDSNNPLFTADFPITGAVDIFANAGFLQVRLTGEAAVCHSGADPDCTNAPSDSHMIEVTLNGASDGTGDLTIAQLVADLLPTGDQDGLLDVDVNVRGRGEVEVSIPGATDFFDTTPTASFSWADITTGSPTFDVTDLSELSDIDFDPSNPGALFSIILKTLQTLEKSLTGTSVGGAASSVFTTEIPLVGRSLSELLASDESGSGQTVSFGTVGSGDTAKGTLTDSSKTFADSLVGRSVVIGTQIAVIGEVSEDNHTLTMMAAWNTVPQPGTSYMLRSELSDAITLLEAAPSDNLQALMKTVNDRLAGTPIALEYRNDGSVGDKPSIVLTLDWQRGYTTSAPLQFSINPSDPAAKELVGVAGKGLVTMSVDGHITIGLVIPLEAGDGPANANGLQVMRDSSVGVSFDATIAGSLETNIGPLVVSVGDPTPDATDLARGELSYSLGLAVPSAANTAVAFTSFFNDVNPSVNTTSDAADCAFGDPTALSACAALPLYWSVGGGAFQPVIATPADNRFELRLPKAAPGGDPDDVIDLNGAAIDGKARLVAPNLQAIFDSLTLDFTQFQGIDQFLGTIESAMNVASFGGKLPLIGEDLQQGADFVGQMRRAANEALGDFAAAGTTKEVADALTTVLNDEFSQEDMAPDFVVDTECSALVAPTGLAHTIVGTAGAGTASYAVAGYVTQGEGPEYKMGPLSSTLAVTDAPATLSGTDLVRLTWATTPGADGYVVFKDVGGTFTKIGEVAKPTLTLDDTGQTPDGAHSNDNPKARDCDLLDLQAIKVAAAITKGKWSNGADGPELACEDDADTKKECLTTEMPLDIGIPGLSLRAKNGEGPEIALGWNLSFGFGISRDEGFFVDAGTGGSTPEVAFGLKFSMPEQMQAQLAIINVNISDCVDNDPSDDKKSAVCDSDAGDGLFNGVFAIDLISPDPDGHLTLGDLSAGTLDSLFDITLSADLDINWFIEAQPGTDDDPGFPGVVTQFTMTWGWANEAVDDADTSSDLAIAFNNVNLDVGAVFSDILGPIVRQLKAVTGPLDPVVKTLYAPIPVLSDLSHAVGGDDVTLVSIAKSFSTIAGGPDLEFVDKVVAIVNLINSLPEGESVLIPIGSFQVLGQKSLDTSATPDNSESLIKPGSKSLAPGAGDGVLGELDSNRKSGASSDGTFNGTNSQTVKAGLAFPVFENPSSLFNLVMGGDVTLVTFDSGPLTLGFTWQQAFGPVYAPPPVLITLGGSASVTARIKAGFDTYGIRKAVEVIQSGGTVGSGVASILQGLFFATTEDDGTPIPVVSFRGEIAAGAQVSALIITVGVEGGVRLTVSFLWNDPNNDGKFRITEFAQAALNNPICLFQVAGELSVFLRVYVTIGISPFSVSFSFTLVDVVLLDFNLKPDCEPPPPDLGAVSGDGTTLVIYAGKLGTGALRGHPSYDNGTASGEDDKPDTVKITSLHQYLQADGVTKIEPPTFLGIAVEMLGIRREFRVATLARVIVDGRGHDAPMKVTFLGDAELDTGGGKEDIPATASFEKDAIVLGGEAKDMIKTGIGNSYVDGGGGDDTIVTGDRTVFDADYEFPAGTQDAEAIVAGGGGSDSITVGNGDDIVAGDRALSFTEVNVTGRKIKTYGDCMDDASGDVCQDETAPAAVTVPDWTAPFSIQNPTSEVGPGGDDSIGLGWGDSTAYGNAGNDVLNVVVDHPMAGQPDVPAWVASAGVTLVGGSQSDTIVGGSNDDTIYTGVNEGSGDEALNSNVDGLGDDDGESADPGPDVRNTVDTGTGDDVVYGSQAEDLVTARSRFTETARIIGGGGDDILTGGYGQDEVFGGPGDDYVIAEPSEVQGVQGVGASVPQDGPFGPLYTVVHQPLPAGVTSNTKTLVGGFGDDHVIGGDGASAIDGDGYNPTDRCEPGTATASDPVDESVNTGADGNDKILGGDGVDNVRAGGGNDDARTKRADDLVCGEKGADLLYGGPDADGIWGGTGADVGFGDDGADLVFGNAEDDVMYGGAGTDIVEGNRDDDAVFGGTEADVVLGGTRLAGRADDTDPGVDDNDRVYGDTGIDQLFGDNAELDDVGVYGPRDLGDANDDNGGRDVMSGGDADDLMFGGLDRDLMFGGNHDDRMQGNNARDTMYGEAGEDTMLGGSTQTASAGVGRPDAGDWMFGGTGPDLILGDNGSVVRELPGQGTPITQGREFGRGYTVTPLDLDGSGSPASTSGADYVEGGDAADVILGQGDHDRLKGNAGDDYVEGAQGSDWIEGDLGADDLAGGGFWALIGAPTNPVGQKDVADAVYGGPGDDVVTGDNSAVLRVGVRTSSTERVGTSGGLVTARTIGLLDLNVSSQLSTPSVLLFGNDRLSGGSGVDVMYGQDGADQMSGGHDDDYLEGNGGSDIVRGDQRLSETVGQDGAAGTSALTDPGWPTDVAPTGDDVLHGTTAEGQDDMMGGSSRPAFRDAGDDLAGNGEGDFQLGDNGTLHRVLSADQLTEEVFVEKYSNAVALPVDAVKVRVADQGFTSTRFCPASAVGTCEPSGAFGADVIRGNAGDDSQWGQDGADDMFGNAEDDTMYGELGDDELFGNAGDDAMLGDRGGIVSEYVNADEPIVNQAIVLSMVPQETYVLHPQDTMHHHADLLHDVNGAAFVGASSAPAMPLPGLNVGGLDRMLGGTGQDSMHGGFNDDLMNGEAGGDVLFGDDGKDVMWGGQGCDRNDATFDCFVTVSGVPTFDPTARGVGDRYVDHLQGGVGDDVLDFRPRGTQCQNTSPDPVYVKATKKNPAVVMDPCSWFQLTGTDDDLLVTTPGPTQWADNEHHEGTDWMYGGWNRDVLQADVSANGNNPGDRQIDWNGSYNLYTVCNSSNGGFNQVRQHSPTMQDFLQQIAWGEGAGQAVGDVTTPGTSAYRELALAYAGENTVSSGSAFPTTPGHFDMVSCQP